MPYGKFVDAYKIGLNHRLTLPVRIMEEIGIDVGDYVLLYFDKQSRSITYVPLKEGVMLPSFVADKIPKEVRSKLKIEVE